jgi:radical SAM protein with 4Fe4S-binding SPASM domain
MQPMHNIPARGGLNFDETPFLAIWEVTQSCDLACKHCRAAAQPIAHPDELTNAEGKALIDQIAAMGVPIFVFTGGDPLKRKDVFELIRYAADKGVQVALTPSATPLLTREAIFKLKEAAWCGSASRWTARPPRFTMHSAAFPALMRAPSRPSSGPTRRAFPSRCTPPSAATTPTIWMVYAPSSRSWPSSCGMFSSWFPWDAGNWTTCSAARNSSGFGQDLRAFAPRQLPDQDHRGHALPPLPAAAQPGRAQDRPRPSGQRQAAAAVAYEPGAPTIRRQTRTASWATRRVNDGKGFLFVSHVGNVYPSGFLPIHAGNIRETPLSEIYRNAPIFKSLRDTSKLEGKCGACEYKEICGGSRARAYAVTGDPLAQEPCCIYQPKHWDPELESEAAAFAKRATRPSRSKTAATCCCATSLCSSAATLRCC